MDDIKVYLSTLPEKPGCYLMKDLKGNIIYVGKAKNLKKRVSSYFNRVHNHKTQLLVNEINDIEIMITANEKESLLLEINLIKQHRPKYNIMFMDDKFYPYIAITKEKHPRLKVLRNTKNKNAYYYGPFPDSGAAWNTLNLLNKIYGLRKCNKIPKKECLYYHLNQCLAPCINQVDDAEYEQIIKEIKSFLNGNTSEMINKLKSKMYEASENLNFELALDYKNLIESVETTTNKQTVFKNNHSDSDYIGVAYDQDYLSIQILIVRNGNLIERKGDIFTLIDGVNESIESYVLQYYDLNILPDHIYLEEEYLSESLKEIYSDQIKVPLKGNHKKMLELANTNAKNLLKQEYDLVLNNQNKLEKALEELQNLLGLKHSIHRIEAFDNSTLQGDNSIGSMVVFEDGLPVKSEYRKFRIRDSEIVDDYAFMREVIYRRYYRVLLEKLKKPDLIIVDGGLGQINVAKKIIQDLNMGIKVIGLVKDEKHRTSFIMDDLNNKYEIDKQSDLFFLLTRIQDEVHRYAITYHRNLRSKSMFSSVLDDVKGIGESRKEKLLKKFGSFSNLKQAQLEDLNTVLPKDVALELYNKLQEES